VADLKAPQFLSKHTRDRAEGYFERYYRNGSSPWFREIKMNRPAFVSINHMTARLSRFNIVPTAECQCGDGLQTEEHTFWDCKLPENQKRTPKISYRVLNTRGKTFVRSVCYFINVIPEFIFKESKRSACKK
jgi:hypothetical protein